EQGLGDRVQRRKNILTGAGDNFETLDPLPAIVQNVLKIVHRRDVGQVAFVVLQDVGNVIEGHVLLGQVVLEIFETLDVFLHLFPLRIGDENDSVHTPRSEERRVGKECSSRWSTDQDKRNVSQRVR